jgi:hypothetical protein
MALHWRLSAKLLVRPMHSLPLPSPSRSWKPGRGIIVYVRVGRKRTWRFRWCTRIWSGHEGPSQTMYKIRREKGRQTSLGQGLSSSALRVVQGVPPKSAVSPRFRHKETAPADQVSPVFVDGVVSIAVVAALTKPRACRACWSLPRTFLLLAAARISINLEPS